MMPIFLLLRASVALSALWTLATIPEEAPAPAQMPVAITATRHDPVPIADADAWIVPDRAPNEHERLLGAIVAADANGDTARVLSLTSRVASDRELGGYARLYAGRAHLARGDAAEARRMAEAVADATRMPHLAEQARLLAAEAAMAAQNAAAALDVLAPLMRGTPGAPERALLTLGRAHRMAGDLTAATAAFNRVVYEYPLSADAASAAEALSEIRGATPRIVAPSSATLSLEIARAERLYGARRYADAKRAFEEVHGHVQGSDRVLASVRLGQIAYHQGRHADARAALAPFLTAGPRQAEARYFDLLATRQLGQGDAFVRGARAFLVAYADHALAPDVLDALGTYYILQSDDAAAARVFTEIVDRYPASARTERAAWKAGWQAYRTRNYAEAIRLFERGAAHFPRSDQRPAWLYWSARAYGERGHASAARARYELVLADYAHSYYGREAAKRLGTDAPAFHVTHASAARTDRSTEETARDAMPNGATIHRLLRAGAYDAALGELAAVVRAHGSTPVIDATVAWATRQRGDLLRASVLMKRAYPQYLSQAGAALPADVLRVTYPVDYWGLIQKHATANRLDPYLIAALIAQESGYAADARSSADAWGLMQVIPATGRSYARKLGIKGFTTSSLVDPAINVQIGTAYFADQVASLGSVHAALAGYNAGPTRARRWAAEQPGLPRDEWIDDIPFPETQFYVKRILGTAADYRALYSGGFDPSLSRTSPRPGKSGDSSPPAGR